MASKYLPNLLAVGCWNIGGLYEKVNGVYLCKMDEELFHATLRKFAIICLQETHTGPEKIFKTSEDFVIYPHCRKISSNSRYFGGMLIIIRKSIQKGVKIGKIKDKDLFEITLQKKLV